MKEKKFEDVQFERKQQQIHPGRQINRKKKEGWNNEKK